MSTPPKPHGKLIYLMLPSNDIAKSATFYREVFGWHIHESADGVTFNDSVDEIHGKFVTQLQAADPPGYILYIMVHDAEATGKRIVEYGGEVADPADRDEGDLVGTFRDPSGNLFGFYEMPDSDEG